MTIPIQNQGPLGLRGVSLLQMPGTSAASDPNASCIVNVSSEPTLDLSMVTANPAHQQASPILFVSPRIENVLRSPTDGWVGAIHNMGFNIHNERDLIRLGEDYERIQPKIVCISTNIAQLGYTQGIYKFLSSIQEKDRPLTIIGGLACVPLLANFFDIAVMGEGDIILPRMLKLAQEDIAEGNSTRIETVRRLRDATVTRRYQNNAGELVNIEVPLLTLYHGIPNIHVRGQSPQYPAVDPVACGLQRKYFLPVPMNQDELDYLFGNQIEVITNELVQRGCIGKCSFCTTQANRPYSGRHLSLDLIIFKMKMAAHNGSTWFGFDDDYFLMNPGFVMKLAKAIQKEGLHKRLTIGIQTRADTFRWQRHRKLTSYLREELGVIVVLGLETLDPVRARLFGKPLGNKPDAAERYVRDSIETIEYLARTWPHARNETGGTDGYYMILAAYGDTLANISRDVLAQMQLKQRMWEKHGYVVNFFYNPSQNPMLFDATTKIMSGAHYFAQPGFLPLKANEYVRLRLNPEGPAMTGEFLVFERVDDEHSIGIFKPTRFDFETPVTRFIEKMQKYGQREARIGDVYREFKEAFIESEADLSDAERNEILKNIEAMDKIAKTFAGTA